MVRVGEAVAALDVDAVPGVWTNPRYADEGFRYGFAPAVSRTTGANAAFGDILAGCGLPGSRGAAHGRFDLAGPADVAWAVAQLVRAEHIVRASATSGRTG